MKKSEMKKKLLDFALENDFFDLRDQYSDSIANAILTFLEEQGMNPPSRTMDCGCCEAEGWEDE